MIPNPYPYDPSKDYNVAGLLPWRLNKVLNTNLLQDAPLGSDRYQANPPATQGVVAGADTPAGTGVVLGGGLLLTVAIVAAMVWLNRE